MTTEVLEPVKGAAPNQTVAEPYVNPIFAEPKRESLLFDRLDPALQEKIKALPDWLEYEDVDAWYNGCSDEMHLAIFWRAENHDGSYDKWVQSVGQNYDPATARAHEELIKEPGSLRLTPASAFKLEPTFWLWDQYLPLGELTLLAGREGIGKSTVAFTLAAGATRGTLPGQFHEEPKSVIIAATEDSWGRTITPRLAAAGADLDRVFHVEVVDEVIDGLPISLPTHLDALRDEAISHDVSMIILDPLTSRLSANLDTHKDDHVRRALEPLTKCARDANVAVLALIHMNKTNSSDSLTSIMGSRAFPAVARSVLEAIEDEDGSCMLGLTKSNLGSIDQPTLKYRIVSKLADGISTGAVEWDGQSDRTVRDVHAAQAAGIEVQTLVDEVAAWLGDLLADGPKTAKVVRQAGKELGYGEKALRRALAKLNGQSINIPGVMPRQTMWQLPSADTSAGVVPTVPTVRISGEREYLPTSPDTLVSASADSGDNADTLAETLSPLEAIA